MAPPKKSPYSRLPPEEFKKLSKEQSDLIRNLPLAAVAAKYGVPEGKKEGLGKTLYNLGSGIRVNVTAATGVYTVLNGASAGIPGKGSTGSKAIDFVMTVHHHFLGDSSLNDFVAAKERLLEDFPECRLIPAKGSGGTIRRAPKRITPPPPPPEKPHVPKESQLPRLTPSHEKAALDYLTEIRQLPDTLAHSLLEHNIVYPTMEDMDVKGKKRWRLKGPALVFPLVHLKEGIVTGYEIKDFSAGKGKPERFSPKTRFDKKESGVLLGHLNKDTETVTMCESGIDSFSKWAIDRPGPEGCIIGTIGARCIDIAIKLAKEYGATVKAAYDMDAAGITAARRVKEKCDEMKVPFIFEQPEKSEVEIVIPYALNSPEWSERRTRLKALRKRDNIPAVVAHASTENQTILHMGNTPAIWDELKEWNQADNRAAAQAKREYSKKGTPAPPQARIKSKVITRKDWNDVLKNPTGCKMKWPANKGEMISELEHRPLQEKDLPPLTEPDGPKATEKQKEASPEV